MASLTRGFCHPGIRPVLQPRLPLLLSERLAPPLRFFASSLRRYASSPSAKASRTPAPRPPTVKPRTTTPTTSTTTAPPRTAAAPSTYAFVKALSASPTPTVLYEGPSHFWFYFGCWSSGLCILTWTCLTGPGVVLNQPEGVPNWVGYVYGSSYVLLTAMGFFLISKTPNIVSSIRVLPARARAAATVAAASTSKPPPPLAATAAAGAAATPDLLMEVTVQRMLPFLKPKTITAPLDKVSLRSRFSLPDEYVPELKRLGLKREEEARRKALHEHDMKHIMTMPFRRLGRSFRAMFSGVRSAWTDMGYGRIAVDGKEYKVNVTKGFAHKGFRTLERIVGVEPK